MEIKYDGLQAASATNLVTLTDVPNILKITDTTGGTKASITMSLSGNLTTMVSQDSQFYITVNDETVTNVMDYNNAVNKSFYISTAATTTAAYVTKALRNCANIAANFDVVNSSSYVIITAKDYKSYQGDLSCVTNIPDAFITISTSDGSSNSALQGALIDVDVYSDSEYITTLEKSFYDGECAFNVSPVLSTISKHGETVPYTFKISAINNGEYQEIGTTSENHSTVGYMVNMGEKYLDANNVVYAQNVLRGEDKGTYNKTILYMYENTIPFSFYATSGGLSFTVKTLDSAFNVITSYTQSWTHPFTPVRSKLFEIDFNIGNLDGVYYVDLVFGDKTLRYTVIKPFKMGEQCTRIYWRNSYGGKSFFDWTGSRTENHTSDVTTFQKNIFNYYEDTRDELNKVYDTKVEYEVTLKSHLMEKDGIWVFNDLLQSKDVWLERDGKKVSIIIDSIAVEEQSQNNIFEATCKFHYSLPSTF